MRGEGEPPDYDILNPVLGSHCHGTNHQDIQDVERVVFLGDSVTVGAPPSTETEFYRNLLAHQLAEEFGLSLPDFWWEGVNIFDGTKDLIALLELYKPVICLLYTSDAADE